MPCYSNVGNMTHRCGAPSISRLLLHRMSITPVTNRRWASCSDYTLALAQVSGTDTDVPNPSRSLRVRSATHKSGDDPQASEQE